MDFPSQPGFKCNKLYIVLFHALQHLSNSFVQYFDNFDILLHKLQYYGVNGVTLLLIKSYLNERYQYTKYDNFDSTRLEIKTGIPQGSILGPLFF